MTINKYLVEIFKTLQNYDNESDKFTKLARLYGTMSFNNKLLMKYNSEYINNKNNFSKMIYFKNTNIDNILLKINEEDKNHVFNNLNKIHLLVKEKLFSIKKKSCCENNNCCHDMNKMLKNKKVQKMLNKKGMKQLLQSQLGKQLNKKNVNLEEMLKSTLKNELPDNEFNMLNTVLNNPMLKSMSEKLLTEENLNKFKVIFTDLFEDKEILNEINKIKKLINETKITNLLKTLFDDLKDLKDLSGIQKFIENNKDLQEISSKFENALNSGLIDQNKLQMIVDKSTEKIKKAVLEMGILDQTNIKNLTDIFTNFGFSGKEEKQTTKEERRKKRIKKNRRKIKSELKQKKNNRKKNKRKRNN